MKHVLLSIPLFLLAACAESVASSKPTGESTQVYNATASVGQSSEELPVDQMVSERVRAAFLDDRKLAAEARAVFIRTEDGVVHLSGPVSTEIIKSRMSVVANAVGSVKRVVNELIVAVR